MIDVAEAGAGAVLDGDGEGGVVEPVDAGLAGRAVARAAVLTGVGALVKSRCARSWVRPVRELSVPM